jgi:hypothetical protein
VSVVATSDGGGYWIIGSDGAIYNYGDATPVAGQLTLAGLEAALAQRFNAPSPESGPDTGIFTVTCGPASASLAPGAYVGCSGPGRALGPADAGGQRRRSDGLGSIDRVGTGEGTDCLGWHMAGQQDDGQAQADVEARAARLAEELTRRVGDFESFDQIWQTPEASASLTLLEDKGFSLQEFLLESDVDLKFGVPDRVKRFYQAYTRQVRQSICTSDGELRAAVSTAVRGGTSALLVALAAALAIPPLAVGLLRRSQRFCCSKASMPSAKSQRYERFERCADRR